MILDIFKVFIDICEKNNLTYYGIGGTCLGAIRRNGFIPWDDDIDLGLPREDFDKLLTQVKLPKGYGIVSHKTDKNWCFNFVQFVDLESEIVLHLNNVPRKSHLWVDIFPLDGMPSDEKACKNHARKIMWMRYLIQLCHINTQVGNFPNRPLKEKLVLGFFKYVNIGKLFNTDKLLEQLNRLLRKYPFVGSDYLGNMLGRKRYKEMMRTEILGTPIKHKFENMEINIPEKPTEYLKCIYGKNFMELPPVEMRETHEVEIIKKRIK